MAAGEIFPYQFQVYRNGILLAQFGEPLEGMARLKFSGDLFGGHFDVLIATEVLRGIYTSHPPTLPLLNSQPCIFYSLLSSQTSSSASNRRGSRKHRARVTDSIYRKRNREAAAKFTKKNPEVNRAAVKTYTQKNPEVNRPAVKTYTHKNSEVNRAAVKTYMHKNP